MPTEITMGTSTEKTGTTDGGRGVSFVVFGFFYNNRNASSRHVMKTKWLRNFEMMRPLIENDHKFSGEEKSKPGTSKKLCVTNITCQAGERQTQEREGHLGRPSAGDDVNHSWDSEMKGKGWN